MKKAIALVLSLLMLVSVFAVFAAAEDGEAPAATTYTVTFIVNGETFNTQTIAEGETPEPPGDPQPYTVDGTVYEFSGWTSSVGDPDKLYYRNTLPAITSDVTFTAKYVITYEPSENPTVTLFSFLQGIFQNLTKIFAAATDNVKTWTNHLGIASDFVRDLFENVF